MKVIKAPPPQTTNEQKISQFRQLFADWKNVKTHTRDMHGAGCGAKIEFEYSDLEHLYYFGMFGGQGHYAAVKCPYCHTVTSTWLSMKKFQRNSGHC